MFYTPLLGYFYRVPYYCYHNFARINLVSLQPQGKPVQPFQSVLITETLVPGNWWIPWWISSVPSPGKSHLSVVWSPECIQYCSCPYLSPFRERTEWLWTLAISHLAHSHLLQVDLPSKVTVWEHHLIIYFGNLQPNMNTEFSNFKLCLPTPPLYRLSS